MLDHTERIVSVGYPTVEQAVSTETKCVSQGYSVRQSSNNKGNLLVEKFAHEEW